MANPARAKGTGWETELLPLLRRLFGPQVERAPLKGIQDKGDFVGVPWLHEAKAVERPNFLEWARKAKAKDSWWVVLWKGDRRKASNPGELVLMPEELYGLLVEYALSDTAIPGLVLHGR